MGYNFNYIHGDYRSEDINTANGFIPYWNLEGKYVGLKYPCNVGTVYYNPQSNRFVYSYNELDW